MHRILSYILIGLYCWMSLTGDKDCSELAKLPDLWAHYKYEKQQDNTTSWWLFVKKHYAGGDHMADECHQNLPFQSHSDPTTPTFSSIPSSSSGWLNTLQQRETQRQAPLKLFYDFSYTEGILKPPRI